MNKKEIKAELLLLLAAAIWGFAFVAQRMGSDFLGPFSFNGIRFALGSVSLIPVIMIFSERKKDIAIIESGNRKKITKYGIIAGTVLFVASTLQQAGVAYTSAGKAGFITGLYMVIVPCIGIFLKEKTSKNTWTGIVIAIVGLYLLCIKKDFSVGTGDFLVFLSSFLWAVHIILIDRFTKVVDSLKLSSIQFATCSILSLICAVIFENMNFYSVKMALIPILYGGILSVGVAYTLQAVAQKAANPARAAIILSMESVFGVIGGALILKEALGLREVVGCCLIFTAILISQIKPQKNKLQ